MKQNICQFLFHWNNLRHRLYKKRKSKSSHILLPIYCYFPFTIVKVYHVWLMTVQTHCFYNRVVTFVKYILWAKPFLNHRLIDFWVVLFVYLLKKKKRIKFLNEISGGGSAKCEYQTKTAARVCRLKTLLLFFNLYESLQRFKLDIDFVTIRRQLTWNLIFY